VNKGIFSTVLVALTALSLLVAGCGGGEDETSSPSRKQFLKQANAICQEQTQKRNKIIQDAISGSDQNKLLPKAEREQIIVDALPPYAETPEKLEALGAPEGDEEKVEAILEAMEKAAADAKANPSVALTSTKQFEEANKLASGYGLTSCIL
jgi:hypothetical protein